MTHYQKVFEDSINYKLIDNNMHVTNNRLISETTASFQYIKVVKNIVIIG